jgi:hypothetical protein
MRVYWQIGVHVYPLIEVKPKEIEMIRVMYPNREGIPMYYSISNEDEVDWWPDSRQGMPIVEHDSIGPSASRR